MRCFFEYLCQCGGRIIQRDAPSELKIGKALLDYVTADDDRDEELSKTAHRVLTLRLTNF